LGEEAGLDEVRLQRAEDELEQMRVALEDARAEAAALAAERDSAHAELLRRTSQLREVEARLRAREVAAAAAQAVIRPARQLALPDDNPETEAETLRSALEEVQVLAEELGEANAALQRSNEALDRKVAERTAALAESNAQLASAEERQRLILESATDHAIVAIDRSGRVTAWNAGARNLLGWDAEEAIGMESAAMFTPEDRAARAPEREMREALATGRALDERWHVRRDGTRFWGEGLLLPLRASAPGNIGEDRARTGFLKILRDRTERRRAEEEQTLLVGELNHRVKNMLALVLAIVDQTWRAAAGDGAGAGTADGGGARFHQGLRTRLMALARAHELLFRDDWERASLADIVNTAVAAHGGVSHGSEGGAAAPAIRASGPGVRLAPEAAVALAMAFHELATNAAKYGALSVPGGRVEVAWGPTVDGRALEITWIEEGGPPIVSPPGRRGFGSVLLERGLARQFGGEIEIELPRGGLRCRARLPLSERVALVSGPRDSRRAAPRPAVQAAATIRGGSNPSR
jgi:PAS domain S-box-containing protein